MMWRCINVILSISPQRGKSNNQKLQRWGIVIDNWCYVMCDSVILPIATVITFLWTAYQEYRHRENEKKKD